MLHPLYGRGTVVRLMGSGLQAKATVQFDMSGERVLVLEYARLQMLPEGEGQ